MFPFAMSHPCTGSLRPAHFSSWPYDGKHLRSSTARRAFIGGLLLQWLLGYNFSVAAAVGYIALFGITVETAVVMVVYLRSAFNERLAGNPAASREDIEAAAIEGAVLRLRPVEAALQKSGQ